VRQQFRQQAEHRGADDGAVQRADAAEHDDEDQVSGALPGGVGRADELRLVGEQAAGHAGDHAGDDVGGELVAVRREADRLHPYRVLADAAQHTAEARLHDRAQQQIGTEQQAEADVIQHGVVL
jgi:hypothetical protein